MDKKKTVAIGFIGTTRDSGGRRRPKWRPSVALCMQDGLPIDRFDLIHDHRSITLAHTVRKDIGRIAPQTEVCLHRMDVANPWDFAEMYGAMRDFADSYPFDPDREDYLVHMTTGTHVAQICWFLLTEARFVPARLLQLSPPGKTDPEEGTERSYAGSHTIIDLDLSRYDSIATRFSAERIEATSFLKSGIATRNASFNAMIDQMEKVAVRSRAPLLLTGPTGAGKSQLARRLFELKKTQRQVTGDFVEVNCATLRGDQAMSTLFGHVRGAFTGAHVDRAGLMKAAHGGVLFLDEIGELGLDEQAMCLQAIEERRFFPLGSDREVTSDFQMVAGTNRDLASDVWEGRFREDLFARLNVWTFRLPSLVERREDIEPNIDYEMQRFGDAEGRKVSFNLEARESYLRFALSDEALWSANFRDLSASVARMGTLAPQGRIDEVTVLEEIERLRALWRRDRTDTDMMVTIDAHLGNGAAARLDIFDRAQLLTVIEVCRECSTLSEAGRALFAESRKRKTSGNDADRLRKYLARFGLSFTEIHD